MLDFWEIGLNVLIILVTIFAMTWVLYSKGRGVRRLKETLRQHGVDEGLHEVTYLSAEDIATGRVQLTSAARALLRSDSSDQYRLLVPAVNDKSIEHVFPLSDCRIAWIDNGQLRSAVPSMIRLHHAGRSHYLIKSSRWLGADHDATHALYERLTQSGFSEDSTLRAPTNLGSWLFAALVAVLVAVGYMLWAAFNVAADFAPLVLAQLPNKDVVAASHVDLYHFDADGQLKQQISVADLGIRDGVSELQALDDKTVLVGDLGAGAIKRCDLEVRACRVLEGFSGNTPAFLRSFQFAVDSGAGHIYVTDTARHRLVQFDANGLRLRQIAGPERLCFPNAPVVVEGRLYVSNTNHHSVAAWSLDALDAEPQSWLTVQEGRRGVNCPAPLEYRGFEIFAGERPASGGRPAVVHQESRRGRVWPMVARRDRRGQWWVLNADNRMAHADIIVFDRDFTQPRRVRVADNADPLSLLVRHDDVLITDTRSGAILEVGLDGKLRGRFGDARFHAEIETRRTRQINMQWLRMYTMAGVGALLVLGLLALGVWRKRRLRAIVAADPAFQTIE